MWCFSLMAWGSACNDLLRDDRPESYTATSDDTLWDISGIFIKNHWLWPEVCGMNHPFANYDEIHPGDVITLTYINGKPLLVVNYKKRSSNDHRTIKLSPDSRSHSLTSTIPPIPLNQISEFLSNSRIISLPEILDQAPYIIAEESERLMSTVGNIVYARGVLKETPNVGIYRKQDTLVDPETKEVLGIMAINVGSATVKHVNGNILTLKITRSSEEILTDDRLLLPEKLKKMPSLIPSTLEQKDLQARIINVIGGVSQIGQLSNVIINKGKRENMKPGHVMAIYTEAQIRDHVTKEVIELPPEQVGLLMIYRTFEKLSYGIVLQAKKPLRIGLLLKAP